MTSTTGGNFFGYEYEPDDMPTRSIPVGELLRREGHASVARAFGHRRGVLTGVAAGAVLAIGAAVGSLMLGHDSGANTLASGASGASGTGAIVPEDGAGAIAATTTGGGQVTAHVQQVTPKVAPMAQVTPQAPAPRPQTHQPVRTAPSTSTYGATGSPSTSRPAPPTTTTPPTSSSPGTGSTSAPPSSPPSKTPPPSSGSGGSGNGGGLLGTVGGVLGGVTQPVFNWFGG